MMNQETIVDFLGEEIRRKNPPSHCVCEHTLMVHAVQNVGTGIWQHGKGRCHMEGCKCLNAVAVES